MLRMFLTVYSQKRTVLGPSSISMSDGERQATLGLKLQNVDMKVVQVALPECDINVDEKAVNDQIGRLCSVQGEFRVQDLCRCKA